jgi:ubiquinone/menaquinone biosynthesis C-methylase UbiE
MTFKVMDVRNLQFENSSVDLAVDKSTIDALLCGDYAFLNVAKMLKEVIRVLKGIFIFFFIFFFFSWWLLYGYFIW